MPRYRVVRKIPAVYVEVYEVDAGSEEEATRSVEGGKVRCERRSFTTTPGSMQPAGYPLGVFDELTPISEDVPSESQAELPSEFDNARFTTRPGQNLQHVMQHVED